MNGGCWRSREAHGSIDQGFLKARTEGVRRIDAQDFHLLRIKGELFKGKNQPAVLWMAFDVGIKLSGEKIPFDHVAFKLRHIDAIGRKAAERLVQGCGHIAYPEK